MVDKFTQRLLEDNQALIDYLQSSRLFGHLTDEQMKKLLPLSELETVPAGTTILKEGERNEKVFFLLKGIWGIYVEGELIHKLQRNGDIVGEMSVVSNKPVSASVITESPSDIFSIRAKDIGNYTDVDSDEIQNLLYRIFAMVMTDKLYITTHKAKEVERAHSELAVSQQRLQTAYTALDERVNQLIDAKMEAEKANHAKSEFLANMSHEFRTPMHAIMSYSKFGMEKSDSVEPEKRVHYFTQIRKSADRLMHLLNDLLDLSKLEFGKSDYQIQVEDIRQIINEAVVELRSSLREKNLQLEIAGSETIIEVECDGYKIGQVIRNLLSNAIKFSPVGKIIKISYEAVEIDGNVELSPALKLVVSDQGVGVPQEELTNIFDKFIQSSRTNTGAGGTGLGLSICHEIIQSHNGAIWANNNPEGGANFNILLPFTFIPNILPIVSPSK